MADAASVEIEAYAGFAGGHGVLAGGVKTPGGVVAVRVIHRGVGED